MKYVRLQARYLINALAISCTAGCSNNKVIAMHRFPAKLENLCALCYVKTTDKVLEHRHYSDSLHPVPLQHYFGALFSITACNIYISMQWYISSLSIGSYSNITVQYSNYTIIDQYNITVFHGLAIH